ncbi:MAG: SDR family oxidoreductase [Planctomycetota bacterium]
MAILNGKLALVTGGSRGIGAAIARKLAAGGASVALTYTGSSAQADELVGKISVEGGRAVAIPVDVRSTESVRAMFASMDEVFGGSLDILVSNAGVQANKPIQDCGLDDLDHIMSVNVRGTFDVVRHAVKRLNDGGRIISVGACLADRTIVPGMSIYAASKAAIAAFTRGWAQDLGTRGITVNCVQPGPIDTDMNPDVEANPISIMLNQATTLKRYGTSDEVASLVTFLASPGGQYITGETINIDGGLNA